MNRNTHQNTSCAGEQNSSENTVNFCGAKEYTDSGRISDETGKVFLSLPAEQDSYPVLEQWLDKLADEYAIPMSVISKIQIAADEIFTNIVKYAYPKTAGTVDIVFSLDTEEDTAVLSFLDSGTPFDPLKKDDPELNIPLEKRRIGGLGILVVKQLMTRVEYQRKGGRNVITITKKLHEDGSVTP